MMTQQAPAGIGDNLPPDPMDPVQIAARLDETHAKIFARADELKASVSRMPAEIGDEAMAAKFTDTGAMVNACRKAADAARVAEKAPFLDGGRQIEAHFRTPLALLDGLKKKIQILLTAFQIKKEREERQRLEAQRKEAEAAARKAEAEAEDEVGLEDAVAAEDHAHTAAKEAQASTAELSRSRGEYGSVASLRKLWTFTIENRSQIPLERLRPYLSDDTIDKAIRSLIRAEVTPQGKAVDLPGVKIFQQAKSAVL